MKEYDEGKPSNGHNHPEGKYFDTKNLNNGIHGRMLGINEYEKYITWRIL